MSLTEALLNADVEAITQKETKDYEVVRLSKKFKSPFILHLQEVGAKRMAEINDLAVEFKKGRVTSVNTYTLGILLICDAVTNPELSDKSVLKHYNAATKKDLLSKLLNAGEISDISNEVQQLSGYDRDEGLEDRVKN